MREHSEVLLEVAAAIVVTWVVSFGLVYVCLSRFVHDTGVWP